MILIRPITIDSANLVASNIPEDEPAWSAGVTYSIGDEARYNHRVYESLIDSNIGNNPATGVNADPPTWLDLGPTNRYRMFDASPSTTSQHENTIQFTVNPGIGDAKIVDAVGLINVSGVAVKVERLDWTYTRVLWSETRSLSDADPLGSGYVRYLTDVVFLTLPRAYWPVRITISANGVTAKCGAVILGKQATIGDTAFGASLGITDYSRKTTDDFGNTTIVKRAYSKTGDFALTLDTQRMAAVQRLLALVRAEAVLYVGVSYRAETIVFGFYKSFTQVIASPTRSTVNIEVESLTYEADDALFPDATVSVPSIILPVPDGTFAANGKVTATAFDTTPDDADSHAKSDWQIASDSDFDTIVHQSMDDAVNKITYTIPAGALSASASYYLRVRYWGTELGASQWSPTRHFTTTSAGGSVNTPSITSPASNGLTVLAGAAVTSSAFATTGGSDTHESSDWQISPDSGFSNVVAESIASTTNKTSWPMPAGLIDGATYYLRVRYNGVNFGASAWSATRSFQYNADPFSIDGLPPTVWASGSGTVVVTLQFKPDGTWTLSKPSSPLSGTWHTGSFSAAAFELIYEEIDSEAGTGASVTNGAATYKPLSSARSLSISCPYNSANGAGEYGANWRVTIREIATPSNARSADIGIHITVT